MDFLKNILTPETYEAVVKQVEEYTASHDEKVRIVNVASGEYVGKGKLDKAVSENEKLRAQIDTLNESLASKDSDADEKIKKLQETIDAIKAQEAARDAETRLNDRFNTARGTNEFINAFTENGVRTAFIAALSAPENAGRSDADVYESVIKTIGEVYKNPHKPSDIPPMGRDVDKVLDSEKFNGMSLEKQMEFANTHIDQFKKLFEE